MTAVNIIKHPIDSRAESVSPRIIIPEIKANTDSRLIRRDAFAGSASF